MTRQYVLRSEDQGESWTLGPHKRHGGWCVPQFNRMDEGRPIDLGGGRIFMMTRNCAGHLWGLWSEDDGRTWSAPRPTPLVHPDAPPMLFKLSDGETLAAFHHNRYSDRNYTGLSGAKAEMMRDRSEIWLSTSADGGHNWSAPRFVFANALGEIFASPFRNYQCSYMDCIIEQGRGAPVRAAPLAAGAAPHYRRGRSCQLTAGRRPGMIERTLPARYANIISIREG